MLFELVKPLSLDNVTSFTLLIRSNKRWGLIHDADGQIRLPQFECEPTCDPEDQILGIVFRLTGALSFEIKPIFDCTYESDGGNELLRGKSNGRIYVVSLNTEASQNERLGFYEKDAIPESVYNRELVEAIISNAEILANIYF